MKKLKICAIIIIALFTLSIFTAFTACNGNDFDYDNWFENVHPAFSQVREMLIEEGFTITVVTISHSDGQREVFDNGIFAAKDGENIMLWRYNSLEHADIEYENFILLPSRQKVRYGL
ncbi:MAG: hypothetical protein FWE03_01020 [Firmicutes bacterium]|nr:hypothetical protein [Bacillota bacterium]